MDSIPYISLWYLAYALVLLGLAGYGFHRLTILFLYFKHSRKAPEPMCEFEELPLVTVQLPVFNEQYVVNRLLKAVSELDYPKDRLEIQVLDDSTDETVKICREGVEKLKAAGFDATHLHRTDRTGFKAGALEKGTEVAKGEFLFILDADFKPKPDVLKKTIHFFTDEGVGMIQTRWGHLNRTFNVLTRVQGMFLDGHLKLEQTARNRSGRFFTFNGTAGIWRKSCISDAGGWDHDTLTEDMDLSYRAQLKGWRFIFLDNVVTPAELPVDMEGFKNQQHRWTKGSIQVCKKVLFTIWKAPVPLAVKLEATAHLTANFAYLLLILLCFLLYPAQKTPGFDSVTMALINLPLFFFASVSVILFYLFAQASIRPRDWWKEIFFLPILLALGIGMSVNNAKAVLEALFNHETAFVRTPKYGIEARQESPAWRRSSYKAIKSVVIPFVELAFGCFFLFVIIERLTESSWFSAILLLPFLGFFYTCFSSVRRFFGSFLPEKKASLVESKRVDS